MNRFCQKFSIPIPTYDKVLLKSDEYLTVCTINFQSKYRKNEKACIEGKGLHKIGKISENQAALSAFRILFSEIP